MDGLALRLRHDVLGELVAEQLHRRRDHPRPPLTQELGRGREPELCSEHAIEPRSRSSLKRPVEGRLLGFTSSPGKRVIKSAGKVRRVIKCGCPQARRPRHACLSSSGGRRTVRCTARQQTHSIAELRTSAHQGSSGRCTWPCGSRERCPRSVSSPRVQIWRPISLECSIVSRFPIRLWSGSMRN